MLCSLAVLAVFPGTGWPARLAVARVGGYAAAEHDPCEPRLQSRFRTRQQDRGRGVEGGFSVLAPSRPPSLSPETRGPCRPPKPGPPRHGGRCTEHSYRVGAKNRTFIRLVAAEVADLLSRDASSGPTANISGSLRRAAKMGTNAEEDVDVVEHADKPDKPDKEAFSSDSESDTEPEEEDDDDGGDGLPVKRQFDKIIADLKSGATDLPDLTLATAFVAERAALLVKKSKRKEQTLLHVLVEAELLPRKIKWLVTALVQLQPANLLAKQDVDFKTPLFSAVSLRQHRLARYMCEAHDDIDSILRIPRGQENQSPNCVHQAIANKATLKDDDLAEFLIRRSSEETLLALDQSGLTPLHLAVEYKRCDEAQVRIVKALVEKCDRALDTTVLVKKKGLKQKIPLSLYKYHEYTAPEASEKDKPAEKDRPERGDGESVERGTAVGPADGQKASSRGVFDNFKPTDHPDAFAPHGLHRVSTHSEAPTGKFGSSAKPSATDAARRGHITIPGPDGVRVGPGTPVVTREKDKNKDAKKGKGSSKSKSSRSRATPESAQEIKQFLKLHFLRKKTHDEALEFLYGPQADRQIYFDLTGMVSTLAESRITEGLSHIVCEDVLQYVAIPHVRVEPNLPVPSKRPPKPDGLGRTDLQILFRWLREDRKVKTILKVIVDDLQEPAHSDEAIEACLAGMGVETWDWKKTDVCPDVIGKVCPEVRVVHLYWSGNNAVLRGWGEPEGLRKLQKLEEVYLHVQPGRETRARTKRYVADFKARMESATRIKVLDRRLRGDPGESSSAADAARDPYERHRWIATMEEFAEFLQTAEKAADLTDKKANIRATSRRDITVALIDDGIDIGEQSIQSRIVGGRSFCSRDKQQNLNQPVSLASPRPPAPLRCRHRRAKAVLRVSQIPIVLTDGSTTSPAAGTARRWPASSARCVRM